MKKFFEKYSTEIFFGLIIILLFRNCNESREISKIKKELTFLNDSIARTNDVILLNNKIDGLQGTVNGFMTTQSFIMENFIDMSVKNKASKDAWSMYTNKINEYRINK